MSYEFPLPPRTAPVDTARSDPQPVGERRGLDHVGMPADSVEDGGRSLIGETVAVVRRHLLGLCLWIAVCLAAASIHLASATAEFAATAQVVLEARQAVPLGSDANAAVLAQPLDSAQAESQMQVIRSGRNLRYVFDVQYLADNPAYRDPGPDLLQRVARSVFWGIVELVPGASALLKGEETSAEEQARLARERAFQTFVDTVSVRRLGQSYVMEIAVRARSPSDAVRLTNAVTMSYIRDQVLVRAASEQRRADFLQNRISVIQSEKLVATKSVADGIIPDFQFPDSDARVVSAAIEPLTKAYPQTKLILLLAGAFGVVSGIAALTVRQSLDRTIRSRDHVRRVLGIDCLGAFARERGHRGQENLSYKTALDLPDSPFSDTLRILRTSLFASSDAGQRVAIGVASCVAGDGRSTIAANLAHLRAVSGDRVVLIDADLRNPAMSRELAPEADRGLNDLLLDPGADGALPEVQLAPSLTFVAAAGVGATGDPNAFLGSHAMRNALARLGGECDVIIDLPPLSESSDAQAIGSMITGVILVAAVNRTTFDQLAEAARALSAANVRLLGVVLNDVETTRRTSWKQLLRPGFRTIPIASDNSSGQIA